jgi:hypothetical protein
MGQHGRRERLDVVGNDVGAPAQRGQGAGRAGEGQGRVRAGAQRAAGVRPRGLHDAHQVLQDRLTQVRAADLSRRTQDLLGAPDGPQLCEGVVLLKAAGDGLLFVVAWVPQSGPEQEAIELCLRRYTFW